jgi:hypothetical protein
MAARTAGTKVEDISGHDKEACPSCQDAPPAYRAIHEVTVDSVNHQRLTNGGGTWVFTPDVDAQAGDLVILQTRDGLYAKPEIFAVGVIAHVAHPWTYHFIKRGNVLLTLNDLRPARATAEATE